MYFPLILISIGFAAGQIIGSNNEERPTVGPISILPYPFPSNGGSNDNRPNNLLTAFQNLFGSGNGAQPIQVQLSTSRPPTNLLAILNGLVNRPQQSTTIGLPSTTTVAPSNSSQNPSTSTIAPILTPTLTAGTPAPINNSTRAIYSTLPFNFSEVYSVGPQGTFLPGEFVNQ